MSDWKANRKLLEEQFGMVLKTIGNFWQIWSGFGNLKHAGQHLVIFGISCTFDILRIFDNFRGILWQYLATFGKQFRIDNKLEESKQI